MNREEWLIGYQYGLLMNRVYGENIKLRKLVTKFPDAPNNGFYAARLHGQYLSREEVEQWINQQN